MGYVSVKILGLQRSGTNWINELIKQNFEIKTYDDPLSPFFKHALPDENHIKAFRDSTEIITPIPKYFVELSADTLFILVYKKPHKWIESILRHPVDLEQKHPEIFKHGKISPIMAGRLYYDYIDSWSDVVADNFLMVSYEEVLRDYIAFLNRIRIEFGLQQSSDFKNVSKVPMSEEFTREKKYKALL